MEKNNTLGMSDLYLLLDRRKWTDVLKGLEVDKEYVFRLPSPRAIHSFKSIAYKLNSFRTGRRYSFNSDNETRIAKVIVKED